MILAEIRVRRPNDALSHHFSGNGQKLGDVKCLGFREDRLERFLAQFYFCDFRPKEFFNNHA